MRNEWNVLSIVMPSNRLNDGNNREEGRKEGRKKGSKEGGEEGKKKLVLCDRNKYNTDYASNKINSADSH